jgi:hypothetical protein
MTTGNRGWLPAGNDHNNAEHSPNVSRRILRSTHQGNKETARATTTTRQRLSQSLQQNEQAEWHGSNRTRERGKQSSFEAIPRFFT